MGTISLVIPQIGQPDTTEDVKVQNAFTTIQTVINGNLDTTNIAPLGGIVSLTKRAVTANTAAVTGQWIECGGTPPYTITLPAAAANAIVAVSASLAVTGASPITVSGGASSLAGVGLSATSMALGTPNSYVVLVCDGSSWVTIAGQQDTGWVTQALGSGWSVVVPVNIRLTGDRVWMQGQASGGTTSPLATIPAQFRPTGTRLCNITTTGASQQLSVTSAGAATMNSAAGSAGFDSTSWAL